VALKGPARSRRPKAAAGRDQRAGRLRLRLALCACDQTLTGCTRTRGFLRIARRLGTLLLASESMARLGARPAPAQALYGTSRTARTARPRRCDQTPRPTQPTKKTCLIDSFFHFFGGRLEALNKQGPLVSPSPKPRAANRFGAASRAPEARQMRSSLTPRSSSSEAEFQGRAQRAFDVSGVAMPLLGDVSSLFLAAGLRRLYVVIGVFF